jgi:Sec-independent protein translocase protein TatA
VLKELNNFVGTRIRKIRKEANRNKEEVKASEREAEEANEQSYPDHEEYEYDEDE